MRSPFLRQRTDRTMSAVILIVILASGPSASNCLQAGSLQSAGLEHSFLESPVLGKQLLDCEWRNVVILCNESTDYDEALLDVETFTNRLAIPFAVYRIGENQSANIVYDQYVRQRVRNFIIVSKNADNILSQMNDLFYANSTNVLSAFPHRSNWLLFLTDGSGVDARHSLLDNVALVEFNSNDSGSVNTLMWRKGRSRQWDVIDRKSLDSASCVIYPNKRNGLNGRSVSWMAIPFSYGLYVEDDPSGKPQYRGFFVDLADVLGEMLNYTSVLLPPASDGILSIEVDDYPATLYNLSAELGLVYFSQDIAVQQGLKATYPVFLDATVAAYVYNPSPDPFQLNIENWAGFGYPVIVCVFGTFFYAVVFYKCASYLASYVTIYKDDMTSTNESVGTSKTISSSIKRRKNDRKISFEMNHQGIFDYHNHNPQTYDRKERFTASESLKKAEKKRSESFIGKICRGLWHIHRVTPNFKITRFLGSHFNQSIIMRPKHVSLRLFIFFWCFYVLQITCIFTGTLTANFAIPYVPPPFNSVAEVLQSNEVVCGTFKETELINRSKSWKFNDQNWTSHLHRFPFTVSSKPKEFLDFMKSPSKKLKVFVYYENAVRFLKHQTNFTDLYITRDNFQPGVLGFVAPNNSDLADIVSLEMKRLHETGHVNKLGEPYLGETPKKLKKENKLVRTQVTIWVLQKMFMYIGIFIIVAGVTLGVELLIHYMGAHV